MFSQAMLQPSLFSSSPGAVVPTDGPVRAGDLFQINVGAHTWPIDAPMPLQAITGRLRDTGISDDIEITYSPASLNVVASLSIRGHAADDSPSAQAFCAEILKLIQATGYALNLAWLNCVITPTLRQAKF